MKILKQKVKVYTALIQQLQKYLPEGADTSVQE